MFHQHTIPTGRPTDREVATRGDGTTPAFVGAASNPRRLRQLPRSRPGIADGVGKEYVRGGAEEEASSSLGRAVQGTGTAESLIRL